MAFAFLATPVWALSEGDLNAQGFGRFDCFFDQRCVINLPCERAWRNMRWYFSDEAGLAYRAFPTGRLRRGHLMQDARWKARSEARAIVMQMREAVASHLTVFDGGGAIYSIQYAANPGSGQFFTGTCEITSGGSAGDE